MEDTATKRARGSWVSMKQRCYSPGAVNYRHYGGRGIVVCDRWRDSFATFLADMGMPAEGMTIDRINPDGNYEPGNCRWATKREQANNTRFNRLIEVGGETPTVAEAARRYGIRWNTLWRRVAVEGLTGDEGKFCKMRMTRGLCCFPINGGGSRNSPPERK